MPHAARGGSRPRCGGCRSSAARLAAGAGRRPARPFLRPQVVLSGHRRRAGPEGPEPPLCDVHRNARSVPVAGSGRTTAVLVPEVGGGDGAAAERAPDELRALLVLWEVLDAELLKERAQMSFHGVDRKE